MENYSRTCILIRLFVQQIEGEESRQDSLEEDFENGEEEAEIIDEEEMADEEGYSECIM